MKKHFLFTAALFAALSLGFVSCENPDDEPGFSLENVEQDDANSDKENAEGSTDGDGTTPSAPEEPMLVATGGATDVEHSSVTLWGRLNTDTLVFFPKVKWGIECSTSKEEMQSHKGKKVLCTTDLVGENSDEYSVAFTELTGGKMLYYNAYLLINDIKYVYSEVDSVHMDVKLTLKPNNSNYGTVTGSGTYDHLAEVTITATLKENYYFAGWSDCDSKELSRTITLTSDSTITANFSLNPCLTVQVNNSNYGTVTGSGLYEKGTEATITATPKANCYFTSWRDGVADNPRTVVVNSDTTFTANFAKKPYLTVNTNNTSYGTVTGSGYYMPGDVATITATPEANCYFTSWSDGVADNPRTVVVNSNTTFTANFAKKPYLTVNTNNTSYVTVTGSGYYMPGDEVTITATPKLGFEFVQWSDGNTENPRTITVTSDVTYTATFKVPDGAFLVNSNGKCVYFSPGNLQYIRSSDTWQFASCQWECVGIDNVTGGEDYYNSNDGYHCVGTALADKVDLFGWSTGATYFGVSTSASSSGYIGSFVDWGTNQIGSDAPNTWRTLTEDEWEYLLNTRPNASSLKGVAQVNGVNGLILLPDSWTCPAGVTFKSGFHDSGGVDYYAAYQTFTAAEWSKMEAAGAVFLPAAGYRRGSGVWKVQDLGRYCSATVYDSDDVYYLYILSDGAYMGADYRSSGPSVRLVKDL